MRKDSIRSAVTSALGVCLASCGLTALLLLLVYAARGIWPFGTDNVAYVDTAQFYLPGYYRIWDALHGVSGSVDWTMGLAESGQVSLRELLQLPYLAFLLVPRDHILEGLSLYLAIRVMIVAFMAGFAVHLRFGGLSRLRQITLALLYTFSGYVLQYYANFSWLWLAALFPLLLFSLERLLRDGKYVLFTALYAYLIYYSVYFTYMLTVFILLFSAAYAVFILPAPLRGDRLFRLGCSAAAAFGVSARSFASNASSIAGTSRFQDNLDTGLMDGLTTWDITATRHTAVMLLGSALALALVIRAVRRLRTLPTDGRREAVSRTRFFAVVLGLLAIPMVFTNIDTAWHFGQYNFFPMRYGFVLTAMLVAAAGFALEKEEEGGASCLPESMTTRRTALAAGIVLIVAALAVLEPMLTAYYREYGTVFLTAFDAKTYWLRYFPLFLGCGILFIALYLLLLRVRSRRLSAWLVSAAVLAQLFTNAAGLAAPNDDHVSSREYDPAYVEKADALYGYFSENVPGALSRAKNVDNSLNAGYPIIAGIASISSVYSDNSALRLGVYRELGCSVEYFRVLDTGGTVFSDMLFGVDTILSQREPDASLYEDTGVTVEGIHIARARYAGTVGLTCEEGALDGYLDEPTMTGRLNMLYSAFTGSDAALAYEPAFTLSRAEDNPVRSVLTVQMAEDGFLYMSSEDVLLSVTLNGERLSVPSYQNPDFNNYPAAFNSNLLYLGAYEANAVVTLEYTSVYGADADAFHVIALRSALLDSFRADSGADRAVVEGSVRDDSVTVTLSEAGAGQALFLPLTWSRGWQAEVNGRAVPVERVMGTFCAVSLDEGENTVVIRRGSIPHIFGAMDAVSLVCLLLCVLWLFIRRRVSLSVPRWAGIAAQCLFGAAVLAVIGFIYITPAVLFITQGKIVTF